MDQIFDFAIKIQKVEFCLCPAVGPLWIGVYGVQILDYKISQETQYVYDYLGHKWKAYKVCENS